MRLPIDAAGSQFVDHKSEPIALGVNETRLLPVIVGGYAELPGLVTAQVGVEIAAAEGELSDADLERVAGGKQDIEAECTIHGGGAINTVMQLNL